MLKDLCFEVIQTCPNNCKFCSSRSDKESTVRIEIDVFKKTIDHFIEQGGIGEISISGGEPFLHPDIFEMVEYCKSKNIKTVIFTTGIKRRVKLSSNEIENLTESEWRIIKQFDEMEFSSISKEDLLKLKKIGLDKIVFDFQASQVEEYNNLMGTKNLMQMELKSMLLASLSGLDVDVHYIPLKSNYLQLPDILECLNIAEIKNISILNFVPQGRGKDNIKELLLDENEMRNFIDIFNRSKQIFNGNIRVGIPLLNKNEHLCTAGYEKLDIKFDGTILPCPAFKELSPDQMKRYGIDSKSIYFDLEDIKISEGTRKRPLCEVIHKNNWSFDNER